MAGGSITCASIAMFKLMIMMTIRIDDLLIKVVLETVLPLRLACLCLLVHSIRALSEWSIRDSTASLSGCTYERKGN